MKITLADDATCANKIFIPRGEYTVALQQDAQQINLVAGGKTIKLPAVRRRSAGKTRITTISFYSGGGPIWHILISTPKHGEWLCTLEYERGRLK